MKNQVLEFLKSRGAKPGETIEYGWFIFRVTGQVDALDVETLDFSNMASFTNDFQNVERINCSQMQILSDLKLQPEWCNLMQYAVVSTSYRPGGNNSIFLRQSSAEGNDSGWYVGVQDDECDLNDPSNLKPISLYEICLQDRRLSQYWLLPQGYLVSESKDGLVVTPP